MRFKPCPSVDDVGEIAAACRAAAATMGIPVTIVISDDGGHVLRLDRLEARVSTLEAAMGKARTAAITRNPTSSLAERVQAMPGLLTMSLTPIGGGVPLMIGGDCVGAIGVSGGTPQQDEEIANAGARLLSTLNAG
jgi:glc operon protein GlcG